MMKGKARWAFLDESEGLAMAADMVLSLDWSEDSIQLMDYHCAALAQTALVLLVLTRAPPVGLSVRRFCVHRFGLGVDAVAATNRIVQTVLVLPVALPHDMKPVGVMCNLAGLASVSLS